MSELDDKEWDDGVQCTTIERKLVDTDTVGRKLPASWLSWRLRQNQNAEIIKPGEKASIILARLHHGSQSIGWFG